MFAFFALELGDFTTLTHPFYLCHFLLIATILHVLKNDNSGKGGKRSLKFLVCHGNLHLKHVKAWLKPNLHKIRKTVITLPGFGIIFAELAA